MKIFFERHIVWWFVGVFAFWIASFFIIKCVYPIPAESGQVGDTFGAINALFSGLAFAGVIYTLLLQQREIENSASILHKEKFEATFFKLIDLHNSITTNLSKEVVDHEREFENRSNSFFGLVPTKIISGKYLISVELSQLGSYFDREGLILQDKSNYKNSYIKYDKSVGNQYDNYLTNIQLIYEFILNHEKLNVDEKFFYLRIFAHQFSEQELAFFFYYYTLSEDKTKADNALVSQYPDLDLMKFVSEQHLFSLEHYKFYDPEFDAK